VIAFEGLLSHDARGTREAYTYHHELINGHRGTPPSRYGAGYVLHGLMVPLIRRHKGGMEFLVFNEPSISGSGAANVPETCARIWMANPRNHPDLVGRKLIILGHSYGGHAANQLANNLNNKTPRVRVDTVVTMDARTKYGFGTLERPSNVERWENYMHSGGISLRGYRVTGADVNASVEGTSHTTIQASQAVFDAANRAIHRP
jgi:hypothetical protein